MRAYQSGPIAMNLATTSGLSEISRHTHELTRRLSLSPSVAHRQQKLEPIVIGNDGENEQDPDCHKL